LKQGRLNIGLVGSDVIGIAIATALQEAGHLVVAVPQAKPDSKDKLEALFPSAKASSSEETLATSDLVLLALSSEEIANTVLKLANSDSWRAGQLVVHFAPEYGHEILQEATSKGAIALAIHPAMHFTGTSLDLRRMKESYFAVSAPQVALPIAQALVIEMGAEPIVIEASQRANYAEAIEVASNFSAMIVNQAVGLLEQAGVANPALVIAPVIESAVDQALSKGHRSIDPSELLDEQ
jgi:predicted short-subunit dehydrogenase-like oxidoreductase (DUF2520 family)